MSDHYEPINEVWPGVQEDLKSGDVRAEDLATAVRNLGGDIHDPKPAAASDFATVPGQAPARIPGTNWHVRLPGFGRGLLQLTWTVYKYCHGMIDFGDSFNIMSALEKLKASFQTLDVEGGEKCVYLAIGKATVRQGLLRKEYPSAEEIAEALRRPDSWCGGKCQFHKDGSTALSTENVRAVLQKLRTKGVGVVNDRGEDRWSVTF